MNETHDSWPLTENERREFFPDDLADDGCVHHHYYGDAYGSDWSTMWRSAMAK